MIQNYQNDPLLHNYLAPSYPLFIQLKSLIYGFATKKAARNAKTDIIQVINTLYSWQQNLDQREKGLCSPHYWRLLKPESLRKNLNQA